MAKKIIKASDILGDNYYIYELTSSNYTPALNDTITIMCTITDIYNDPINNKSVTLYKNDININTKTTNTNGIVTWSVTCTDPGLQSFKVGNKTIEILVDNKSNSNHTHTTSDITNLSIPNPSNTIPLSDTTNGSAGTDTTWARSNHIHPKSSLYAEANHTHDQYLTEHQSLEDYVTTTDPRLSDARTPQNHTHGELQNNGQIGSIIQANKNVVTNSNGLITTENKPTIPTASSTTPSADTASGSYGSGTSYARANHIHPKSSLYAETNHTHIKSQITDFPNIPSASTTTPSADTNSGSVGTGVTWARSNHTHPKSSLYAEANHTHPEYIQTINFDNIVNYELLSDNYNPNINGSFTLTVKVTDVFKSPIENYDVYLLENGNAYYDINGIDTSHNVTDINGKATWTIECYNTLSNTYQQNQKESDLWNLRDFSVGDAHCQIQPQGWRTVIGSSGGTYFGQRNKTTARLKLNNWECSANSSFANFGGEAYFSGCAPTMPMRFEGDKDGIVFMIKNDGWVQYKNTTSAKKGIYMQLEWTINE